VAHGDQVVATVPRQVDDVQAGEYSGTEVRRLTATYLVKDGPAGRRISVMAVDIP
jgi:hypothetical protein